MREDTRLGCRYADRYYAEQFNIPKEEAQEIYICASNQYDNDGIPECPFIEGCLESYSIEECKESVVDSLLNVKTCKLIPVEYSQNKTAHQCTNCQGIIRGEIEFMNFCYKCGGRRE